MKSGKGKPPSLKGIYYRTFADTLKQEIDENSLQMAHFVYSQDGYFLQLAESVASTEGTVQYKYNNELAEGFQMAMVPSQNIVGGTF